MDIGASGARTRSNGESIAQRSRRSQRGIGINGESARWTPGLPVREPGKRGEHRTEVTEGDRNRWERAAVNVWDSGARNRRNGESIPHRSTEVTEGGWGKDAVKRTGLAVRGTGEWEA